MKRPCIHHGCPALVSKGSRCPLHLTARQRMTTTQRGLGYDYQRLRPLVLERDGYRCHWCGKPANTVDHLVSRAQGGMNVLENLVAACKPCNSSRGSREGWERR